MTLDAWVKYSLTQGTCHDLSILGVLNMIRFAVLILGGGIKLGYRLIFRGYEVLGGKII